MGEDTEESQPFTTRVLIEIREKMSDLSEAMGKLTKLESDMAALRMDVGEMKDRLNAIWIRQELQTRSITDLTKLLERQPG